MTDNLNFMNNLGELPPDKTYRQLEGDDDLHTQAGLVDVGVDEEGEIQYIGTRSQWSKFEQLTNSYENSN